MRQDVNMNRIKLNKGDVTVRAISQVDCERCNRIATHEIVLDLRYGGSTVILGHYCESCVKTKAKSIQDSLPGVKKR